MEEGLTLYILKHFDITGHAAHSVAGSQNGDSGHYSIGHYDPNNIVTNPLKKKVYLNEEGEYWNYLLIFKERSTPN